MSNNITLDELENKLAFMRKMYDAVRLVDPIKKVVLESRGNSCCEMDQQCYAYWNKGKICDNCVSIRAYRSNNCHYKLELLADTILMVTAIPIENDGNPIVIELLKDASQTMMIGYGDYSDGRLMNNMVTGINDLVIKDELTGLYNRRFVNERLSSDIVKSKMEGLPLSVIFLDVDNLKEVNDVYGHIYGDRTLIEVANTLLNCIRADTDWVARFGGDEFLICLNNTVGEIAYQIAERIRNRIGGKAISYQGKEIHTTVSLGIHTVFGNALTAEELISLADSRMYEAKRRGKNTSFNDEAKK